MHAPTYLAFLALSAPLHASSGTGAWETHAPLGTARQEVGAARIGGEVYVTGGLLAMNPFTATDTVEVYDLASDSWSFGPPMPAALDHMMTVSSAGKLYVIGGFSGDFVARDTTYVYDPQTGLWSTLAPMPFRRGAAWAVALDGHIYVFGGQGPQSATRSNLIYDIASDSWSLGAQMPTVREHLTATAWGDFLYVVGGRNGGARAALERYDPALDTWTVLTPMPTARSATGTAAFAGRIYVMGGEVPQLFDVNEVYDIATDTWSTAAPMPVARHGVAAVALEERIFLPAGGTVQGLQPTTHADSFLPCPGVAPYCFCDGGAPCANEDALAGCANAGGAGSRLEASGTTGALADDLVLRAVGIPPQRAGLLFMGGAQLAAPFQNGQRCVGAGAAGLFRYGVRDSGAAGEIVEGPGLVSQSAARFGPAGTLTAGATWNFQVWYRDGGGPCGTTSNFSSALSVSFVP